MRSGEGSVKPRPGPGPALQGLVAALVTAAAVVGYVTFVGTVLLAVVAAVPVFSSLAFATFVTALLSHSRLLRLSVPVNDTPDGPVGHPQARGFR